MLLQLIILCASVSLTLSDDFEEAKISNYVDQTERKANLDCGGIFSTSSFLIETPNYPSNYPSNADCFFVLQGPLCTVDFNFRFLDFSLEQSLGCSKDRLEIDNKDALCGVQTGAKTYRAENGVLQLKFVSDYIYSGRGFRILISRGGCVENNLGPSSPKELDIDEIGTSENPVIISPRPGIPENINPAKPESPIYHKNPNIPINATVYFYPNKPNSSYLPGWTDTQNKFPNSDKPNYPNLPFFPNYPYYPNLPSKPNNPIEPNNPDCSVSSNYPTVQPNYPVQPDYPVQPNYPVQPDYPVQPNFPIRPNFPLHPNYPMTPNYPLRPSYPYQPSNPVRPNVPIQPNFPIHPTVPIQPNIPMQPNVPVQPNVPIQPNFPIQPNVPIQPNFPMQPIYPVQPNFPNRPTNPFSPDSSIKPNYPTLPSKPNETPTNPNSPSYSKNICCGTAYNSKHFILASPGFPYSNQHPTDCEYHIYRSNEKVCRLRIHFLFFWSGEQDQYNRCNRGSIKIDGKDICGCRIGLKLISPFDSNWGNYPKVIQFNNQGYPKSVFSGFAMEIIQDECPTKLIPGKFDGEVTYGVTGVQSGKNRTIYSGTNLILNQTISTRSGFDKNDNGSSQDQSKRINGGFKQTIQDNFSQTTQNSLDQATQDGFNPTTQESLDKTTQDSLDPTTEDSLDQTTQNHDETTTNSHMIQDNSNQAKQNNFHSTNREGHTTQNLDTKNSGTARTITTYKTKYYTSKTDEESTPKFYFYNDQINRIAFPNISHRNSIDRAFLLDNSTEILDSSTIKRLKRDTQVFKHFYYFQSPDYDESEVQFVNEPKEKEETNYFDTSRSGDIIPDGYDTGECRNWGILQWTLLTKDDLWRQTQKCSLAGSDQEVINGNYNHDEERSEEKREVKQCYDLNYVKGYFHSPGYPFFYPGNLNLCYRIVKHPGYCFVKYHFIDFRLEDSADCHNDYVMFNKQKRFCGKSLCNSVFTVDMTNKLYEEIGFVTNRFYCGRGFKVLFQQLPCKHEQPPHYPHTTEPTPTSSFPPEIDCNLNIPETDFEIQILNQRRCSIRISRAHTNICSLSFELKEFDTQCSYERFSIEDSTYCGQQSGRFVSTDFFSDFIEIKYEKLSDDSARDRPRIRIIGKQTPDCILPPAQRQIIGDTKLQDGIQVNDSVFAERRFGDLSSDLGISTVLEPPNEDGPLVNTSLILNSKVATSSGNQTQKAIFKDICGVIINTTENTVTNKICRYLNQGDMNCTLMEPTVIYVPQDKQQIQLKLKDLNLSQEITFKEVKCNSTQTYIS